VLKKRYNDIKSGLSGAIKVERGVDLGMKRVEQERSNK